MKVQASRLRPEGRTQTGSQAGTRGFASEWVVLRVPIVCGKYNFVAVRIQGGALVLTAA